MAEKLLQEDTDRELWQHAVYNIENIRNFPDSNNDCNIISQMADGATLQVASKLANLINVLNNPDGYSRELKSLNTCMESIENITSAAAEKYTGGELLYLLLESKDNYLLAVADKQAEAGRVLAGLFENSRILLELYIRTSNPDAAVDQFNRFTNTQHLTQTAKEILDQEIPYKVENLLQFAFMLNNVEQGILIYEEVGKYIQENLQENLVNILSFNKVVTDEIIRLGEDLPPEFSKLVTQVTLFSRIFTNSVPTLICNNNFLKFTKTASPNTIVPLLPDAFSVVMAEMIKEALTKCGDNIISIASMIRNLGYNRHKLTGMVALMEDKSKYNLSNAIYMHTALSFTNEDLQGPDGDQDIVLENLNKLKDSLPALVKILRQHLSVNLLKSEIDASPICLNPGTSRLGNHPGMFKPETLECNANSTWELVPYDEKKFMYLLKNPAAETYLGSYIPWKDTTDEIHKGILVTSTENIKFPEPYYVWKLESDDLVRVRLFHVGRKAYLSQGLYLDLQESKIETNTWVLKVDDEEF